MMTCDCGHLTLFLWILVLLTYPCHQQTLTSRYIRRDDFAKDLIFSAHLLDTQYARNLIKCVSVCSAHSLVQSLTYTSDMTSPNCRCYDHVMTYNFPAANKISAVGAKLYVLKYEIGKKILLFFVNL